MSSSLILQMKDAYNRLADAYHNNRETFDLRPLYIQLKQNLPSVGKLLDLGCGAGDSVSLYFAQDGWEIDGYDFSEAMLTLAARNNPKMKTCCCDLCEAVLEREMYDAVISVYAIFHLPLKEQFRLMEKVYDALLPGGYFFFTAVPTSDSEPETVEEFSTFMGEELFYAHIRPERLEAHLTAIGFNIVSLECRLIGGENFLWCTVQKK